MIFILIGIVIVNAITNAAIAIIKAVISLIFSNLFNQFIIESNKLSLTCIKICAIKNITAPIINGIVLPTSFPNFNYRGIAIKE